MSQSERFMEDRKEGLWKPQLCQLSWKHHFGKRVSGCSCGRCVSGNDDQNTSSILFGELESIKSDLLFAGH